MVLNIDVKRPFHALLANWSRKDVTHDNQAIDLKRSNYHAFRLGVLLAALRVSLDHLLDFQIVRTSYVVQTSRRCYLQLPVDYLTIETLLKNSEIYDKIMGSVISICFKIITSQRICVTWRSRFWSNYSMTLWFKYLIEKMARMVLTKIILTKDDDDHLTVEPLKLSMQDSLTVVKIKSWKNQQNLSTKRMFSQVLQKLLKRLQCLRNLLEAHSFRYTSIWWTFIYSG